MKEFIIYFYDSKDNYIVFDTAIIKGKRRAMRYIKRYLRKHVDYKYRIVNIIRLETEDDLLQ